jgi:hypothetical protein
MNVPSFHDGYFDGLWLGPDKAVHLFLRTNDHRSYTLALQAVQALTLSEVRAGNIIFDLVFRSTLEITGADMVELYGVDADTAQAKSLLDAAKEKELQVLELNSSYGARGMVLFHSWEITGRVGQPSATLESRS